MADGCTHNYTQLSQPVTATAVHLYEVNEKEKDSHTRWEGGGENLFLELPCVPRQRAIFFFRMLAG